MMKADDSDEDNSSADDVEGEVSEFPDWERGSSVAYGTTSSYDSDDDKATEMVDGSSGVQVSNLSAWMRPSSNYASTNVDSESDNESGSDSDDGPTGTVALPSLSHWLRASTRGSTAAAYSCAATLTSRDSERETPSLGDASFRNWEHRPYTDQCDTPGANRGGGQFMPMETFLDEGIAAYGKGYRHGAIVYDDWGLPISNPSNFREGRDLCRPWLAVVNLFAVCLVVGIIIHGGPSTDYHRGQYNWLGQPTDVTLTSWGFVGEEFVGPIPDLDETPRLAGFGHHVAMNEQGDRLAIARTSGHQGKPGEVYVYSWKDGFDHRHNHPVKPGKWRLEQILTAELDEDDQKKFHFGQQHTPLAISSSGHRIAFTEGDHVFIFESIKSGDLWEQIAKIQPLDHDYENYLQEQAITKQPAVTLFKEASAQKATEQTAQLDTAMRDEATDEQETNTTTKGAVDETEEDDDDDDDAGADAVGGGRRQLTRIDWEQGDDHFGKHLAFSHDGRTLAVMGYSRQKGGYIRIFHDENEDIVKDGHDEIHHLFEPTPDIFLEQLGDSLALSGDGKVLAIGVATSNDLSSNGQHNGVVQVLRLGIDDEWYRIGQPLFGAYPMEAFGGSVSLSEDGNVLAVGVAYGGGPVKVFAVEEIDEVGKKWHWNQMGQTLRGSNHREHFGAQVKLSHNGTVVAVGAPGSPGLLDNDEPIEDDMEQYLHGRAYTFGFDAEANEWTSAGEAISAYEADAFGYSLALSGDGDRLVVGAPFRIVEDIANVGIVEVFQVANEQ